MLGRVDPVVERPHQTVGVVLGACLPLAVRVGHQLLGVGAQIAVGVARQPEIRRLGDQHAAVEDLQGARQHEAVEEDRPLVHLPVIVHVFEDDDPAGGIAFRGRGEIGHEPRHFDRPQPSVRIEVDQDRILDHRLRRDELEAVAWRREDGLHGRGGSEHRGLFRHVLERRRPLTACLKPVADRNRRDREERGGADSGAQHVIGPSTSLENLGTPGRPFNSRTLEL